MDLVPLLVIDGPGDYGWQPSSRGEAPVKTSVTKQLEFIRARKEAYANFAALVRMLKYWRNFNELDDSLRSFTIELIVSHLQDAQGCPPSLEAGLLRFFLYVVDSQLKTPITFTECGDAEVFPEGPRGNTRSVQRRQQRCQENHGSGLRGIVEKCREAWETLSYARNYNGKDADPGTVERSIRPVIRNRGMNMSYTESVTQTYTIADIGKVIDCFAPIWT